MLNDLNVSWLYQQTQLFAESNDRAGDMENCPVLQKACVLVYSLGLNSLTLRHIFVSTYLRNIPVQI